MSDKLSAMQDRVVFAGIAAQTDNPLLKNSLLKVAQRNVRLAVGLEEHRQAKLVLRLITPEML